MKNGLSTFIIKNIDIHVCIYIYILYIWYTCVCVSFRGGLKSSGSSGKMKKVDARKYRYWGKHIYVWAIIYHSPGPLNTEGIALDPFYGTLSPLYGSSVSSKCPSGTWWSNCCPVCSGPLIPRQSTAGASLAEPWGTRCQRNDLELQGCLARRMERWLMYWWWCWKLGLSSQ